jgi:hypothetical protein
MAEQKQTTGEHEVVGISGEKGRWSVAEEALLPRGGFGGRVQRSAAGVRLRRLCLRR